MGRRKRETGREAEPLRVQPVGGGMPAATEEDWQRRQEHRQAGIDATKRSALYQRFACARAEGRVGLMPAPSTPNPTDRSISKRKWESGMQMWKQDLQSWASNFDGEAMPFDSAELEFNS